MSSCTTVISTYAEMTNFTLNLCFSRDCLCVRIIIKIFLKFPNTLMEITILMTSVGGFHGGKPNDVTEPA